MLKIPKTLRKLPGEVFMDLFFKYQASTKQDHYPIKSFWQFIANWFFNCSVIQSP